MQGTDVPNKIAPGPRWTGSEGVSESKRSPRDDINPAERRDRVRADLQQSGPCGPHAQVEWSQIHPLSRGVVLATGDVFHLGAPRRGVTIVYVETRRLGLQPGLLSTEAAPDDDAPQRLKPVRIEPSAAVPQWFVPALLIWFICAMVAILVILAQILIPPTPDPLPVVESIRYITPQDVERLEQSDL